MVNPNIGGANQIQNQFNQATVQGQVDLQFQTSIITGVISSAVNPATPLYAGAAVKIENSASGVPAFLPLSADTDAPFGFITYDPKDINDGPLQAFNVAMAGTVLYMTANAAIARGAKIQVRTSDNTVSTNLGTNPVSGFALDAATAANQLIRVYVLTPTSSAQTIADIAGLQAALDALGDGAVQVITALNTVGAGTITAAGIIGGNTARGGTQTAIFSDTTDIATNIVAALPNIAVNDSFYYTYYNNTAYQATLGGGTGVTVSGQTIIAPKAWVKYLVTYTGTDTFTMIAVEAGMINNTLNNFINGGAKVCTAEVDRVSSTTLTTVTGCSVRLEAGGTYLFRAHITGTATANGGAKAAISGDGTLSATSFTCTGNNVNGTTANARTTTTTLGTAVGGATAVLTDFYLDGAIVVNVAGVLNLQFAQNASSVDTSSAYVNSYLEVTRVA